MKKLIALSLILLAGCSNQARLDYYAAIQAAAEAQARESEARYMALSNMARSGDPGASTAAVMAIALAQKPTVQPQYIEDDALKWAQVLAGPVAAIASLAIQADLSRDLNKNNSKVAIARLEQDAATDQALYEAITRPQPTPAPSISVDGLGVVVDGLVDLGTAGISGVGSMGQSGLDAVLDISTLGITSVSSTATTGYQTIEEIVGQSYMTLDSIAAQSPRVVTPDVTPTDGDLCVSPCVAVSP